MATMVEVVALSNGCVEHPKTRRDTLSGTVPPSPPTNLAALLNVPTKTVAQPTSPTRPLTVSATRETHESRGENGRLGLDVAVIPSKRERLKRLTFASKLEKVADRNAKFEQCDEERLAAFEQYLANNDRRLFQGFPANRRLGVSLVSISGRSDSTPVTYICIQGLQNEREIVRCHAILSQKLVRDEYKPLRLCYDKSQIRAAAADDDDYCADVDPDGMTLCGTLIRQGGAGEASHLSTIGGVLQIDGSLYAVTTSHSSQEEEESADPLDGSTEQGSASATDVELDVDEDALDDDTEPPLVVDEWRAEEWRETYDTPLAKSPLSAAQYGKHPDRSWPNMGKVFKDGTDWRLISIDDKLLWRPNVLSPVPREGEGVPDHIYLNHFDTQPHRKSVHVLAGRSGHCAGTLIQNRSFLRLRAGLWVQAWRIEFSSGFTLAKGDSGSWVIDKMRPSVAGHVVAISDGSAHIIPLHQTIQEIRSAIPESDVRLPSPFTLLANLAWRFHLKPHRFFHVFGARFAAQAVSLPVLKWEMARHEARLIYYNIEQKSDRELAARLLHRTGADLTAALSWPNFAEAIEAYEGHETAQFFCRLREAALASGVIEQDTIAEEPRDNSVRKATTSELSAWSVKTPSKRPKRGVFRMPGMEALTSSPRLIQEAPRKSQSPTHGSFVLDHDESASRFVQEAPYWKISVGSEVLQRAVEISKYQDPLNEANNLTITEKHYLWREGILWKQPTILYLTYITCALGAVLYGWIQASPNGANLNWPEEWGLHFAAFVKGSPESQKKALILGVLNAAPLLAAGVIGIWVSLLFFTHRGRRQVIFIGAALSSAGSLGQAFRDSWQFSLAFRLVLGIGLGIGVHTIPSYLSDIFPAKIRGVVLRSWQLCVALGTFFGFCANLAFDRTGALAWRLQLGSSILPAFLLLVGSFFLPESPRWLLRQGRHNEALRSLRRVRWIELQAVRDLYLLAREDYDSHGKIYPSKRLVAWRQLANVFKRKKLRGATLASMLMMSAQPLCGIHLVVCYSSILFTEAGASRTVALWLAFGFGGLSVYITGLSFTRFLNRGSPMVALLSFIPITAAMMLAAGLSFLTQTPGSLRTGLFATFIFLFACWHSPRAGVAMEYSAQVFPPDVRDAGLSLVTAVNLYQAGAVVLTFPILVLTLGVPSSLGIFAGLNVLVFVLIVLFVPDIHGLSREEIQRLFEIPTIVYVRYVRKVIIPWWFRHYILGRRSIPKPRIRPLFDQRDTMGA